jgi:hypothetical protein
MAAPEVRPRGARLPRSARRTQLLGAAREVFVAQGYHAAAMDEFYAFIDSESESFRLVFESDFTNDPEVRELLERMQRGCAEAIAEVIEEDTGLPAIQAHLLAVGLTGISHVTARWWIQAGRPIPRDAAAALVTHLSWRGIGGFPKADGKGEGNVDGKAGPA